MNKNITNKLPAVIALLGIILVWQLVCSTGIVPSYMLPSPIEVMAALVSDFDTIMYHAGFTIQETIYGLLIGIGLSFMGATLMDRFKVIDRAFYPLMIITQTIPTIAIAPILVLWFGFDMAPKIILVVITTYFPIAIGLLDGYKSVDKDEIDLMRSMGAGRIAIFRHVKFPAALPHFFSGLKIASSYAVVGAVVSEWLGGFNGLGVYMTRMRKAYAFDNMFAVIILIIIISLLLLLLVNILSRAAMPWKGAERRKVGGEGHRSGHIVKVLIACGVVFCMIFAIGGCIRNTDADNGLTKITFCLDWTPNTNHTGLYVAQAQGWYEEAGLEVEIVQPPENGAAHMCASGEAQFAIEAQDTMAASLALDEPLGITAVAAVLQHNTSGIMSRAGDGIDRPAGLTGRTYSTWDSPIEMATLKHVVEADGGNFDKVKLIPNDITDEPAALKAEQTDAVWVFEGWSKVNAQVSGVDVDYFAFKDIDTTFDYYTPVIIANNDFIAEDPETAKAFLEVTARGYIFAAENPEAAADMLIAGDNTGALAEAEELVRASQEFLSPLYIDDADRWGVIDAGRWNDFYKWLYENELCSKDLTNKGFSNEYLPE